MAIATPSPSNDAALNAQLDITRDASIANLEQKSEEVRQQYRDEAAKNHRSETAIRRSGTEQRQCRIGQCRSAI